MPVLAHKKPCKVCPMRRTSAAGWLGASTPEEFAAQIRSETHMPCHATIDYEDKNWRKAAETAPFCAGALIFLRNHCILPRDPVLADARNAVEADRETVFGHTAQFLDHHNRFAKDPA